MGHGAGGGDAVGLVADGAGGAVDAADVGRPGPHDGAVHPLSPAGAELQHRAAVGSPDHPVGLGSDEALVVDAQQGVGLDELGLGGGRPDRHKGLAGEYRRALRHSPDIAGKAESAEIVQKILLEKVFAPEIGDVLLVKVEVPDVLHQLLQPRRDGEAAAVRHAAEEYVKVGDALLHPLAEVAVGHGHLVKVKEHGQV